MQENQQNQGNKSGQSTQTEDKQNLQKMNKSGSGENQGDQTDRTGKMGQNQDADVDERTNVDQRSGDAEGGAQRQATGQKNQFDQTGTRNVENSAGGRGQQFGADND